MWDRPESKDQACRKTQDRLEEIAGRRPQWIEVQELTDALPVAERAHWLACRACREAAEDLVTARQLLRAVPSAANVDRPFFARRVMAVIAAREKELRELVNPWAEVPRFATRLAWITALVLLAGSTWFYEKGMTTRSHSPMAGPESIFEPTPPATQDDVLMGMAEVQP